MQPAHLSLLFCGRCEYSHQPKASDVPGVGRGRPHVRHGLRATDTHHSQPDSTRPSDAAVECNVAARDTGAGTRLHEGSHTSHHRLADIVSQRGCQLSAHARASSMRDTERKREWMRWSCGVEYSALPTVRQLFFPPFLLPSLPPSCGACRPLSYCIRMSSGASLARSHDRTSGVMLRRHPSAQRRHAPAAHSLSFIPLPLVLLPDCSEVHCVCVCKRVVGRLFVVLLLLWISLCRLSLLQVRSAQLSHHPPLPSLVSHDASATPARHQRGLVLRTMAPVRVASCSAQPFTRCLLQRCVRRCCIITAYCVRQTSSCHECPVPFHCPVVLC